MPLEATIDSWGNTHQAANELLSQVAQGYQNESKASFPQLSVVVGDNWYYAAVHSNGNTDKGDKPNIPSPENGSGLAHFRYEWINGYIPLADVMKIINPLLSHLEGIAIVPLGQKRQDEILQLFAQLGSIESNGSGHYKLDLNGKTIIVFPLSATGAQAAPETA